MNWEMRCDWCGIVYTVDVYCKNINVKGWIKGIEWGTTEGRLMMSVRRIVVGDVEDEGWFMGWCGVRFAVGIGNGSWGL